MDHRLVSFEILKTLQLVYPSAVPLRTVIDTVKMITPADPDEIKKTVAYLAAQKWITTVTTWHSTTPAVVLTAKGYDEWLKQTETAQQKS